MIDADPQPGFWPGLPWPACDLDQRDARGSDDKAVAAFVIIVVIGRQGRALPFHAIRSDRMFDRT